MSFSLLGGKQKNPYLPTLFLGARYANITYKFCMPNYIPQAARVFFGDGLFDLAAEKDEEATAFAMTVAR